MLKLLRSLFSGQSNQIVVVEAPRNRKERRMK